MKIDLGQNISVLIVQLLQTVLKAKNLNSNKDGSFSLADPLIGKPSFLVKLPPSSLSILSNRCRRDVE